MVSNIPNVGNYQYQQYAQSQNNKQVQTGVNQNSTNSTEVAAAAQAALQETGTPQVAQTNQVSAVTTNPPQAPNLTPELSTQAQQVATQATTIPTFNDYSTMNLPFENSLDINNPIFMQNQSQYNVSPQVQYQSGYTNSIQQQSVQTQQKPLALDTNNAYFNVPPKNNTNKSSKCAADKSDNAAIVATIGLGVVALLAIIFDPAKRNPQTFQIVQKNYNNAIPDFFSNLGTKIKNWWNPSRSKKVVQNNGQGFFSKIGSKFKNGWQATTNKTKNKFQKLKEKLSLEKVTENLINTICKKPQKKTNGLNNITNKAQKVSASINPNDYKIIFKNSGYERHYNNGKIEVYDAIGNLINTINK